MYTRYTFLSAVAASGLHKVRMNGCTLLLAAWLPAAWAQALPGPAQGLAVYVAARLPVEHTAARVLADALARQTDGEVPHATELSWTPVEHGAIVGRAYSSCTYYHLQE